MYVLPFSFLSPMMVTVDGTFTRLIATSRGGSSIELETDAELHLTVARLAEEYGKLAMRHSNQAALLERYSAHDILEATKRVRAWLNARRDYLDFLYDVACGASVGMTREEHAELLQRLSDTYDSTSAGDEVIYVAFEGEIHPFAPPTIPLHRLSKELIDAAFYRYVVKPARPDEKYSEAKLPGVPHWFRGSWRSGVTDAVAPSHHELVKFARDFGMRLERETDTSLRMVHVESGELAAMCTYRPGGVHNGRQSGSPRWEVKFKVREVKWDEVP